MSEDRPSYDELQDRLARAEATLDALRKGETDLLIGKTGPLRVQLKHMIEETERLAREWQTTFNAVNNAIWVLDTEQRIARSNLAAGQIFHRPVNEMVGKRSWEIIYGSKGPIPNSPFERMRKSLKRESSEFRYGERCLEATVDPILDANNQLAGAVHIVRDITERKRIEEALRINEERYRQISNLISDYAYAYRVGENNQLAREWVTDSFTRITGHTPEEVDKLGDWLSLVHPDDMPTALKRAERLLAGQQDVSEFRIIRKDGIIRWLRDHGKPIWNKTQGRVIRIYGAAEDITERKQRELEMQAVTSVSSALCQVETRAEMKPIILDKLMFSLNANGAVFETLDIDSGGSVVEMGRGIWASIAGAKIPPDQGLSTQVVAARQPYLNNDARNDPWLLRPDLIEDNHAIAGMPLIVKDQLIGIVWIARKANLTSEDLHLIAAIADIAANAIHRAYLHEQAKLQVEQLTALREIDRAIIASFDMKIMLDVIVKQATILLKADAAAVLLFNHHSLRFEYIAGYGFRTPLIKHAFLGLGDDQVGRSIILERRPLSILDLRVSASFARSQLAKSEGLIAYYASPIIAKGESIGVLEVFHRSLFIPNANWMNLFEILAEQAAIAINNAQLFTSLQRTSLELSVAYEDTIEGWSRALDLRDKETEGHTQRVTELSVQLARAMGVKEEQIIHIRRGALLHDIGKMGIPDGILLKPDKLNDEEWDIMRQHPRYAYEMLSPIEYLQPALEIPYCHHEKWDGSGYPQGLKGEQIPLAARIFAVVDVWDALISDRPYRKAWPREDALKYIRQQSGIHFDPRVVELFLRIIGE